MEVGGMVFVGLVIFCFTVFGAALGIASFEDSRRTRALAKSAGQGETREKIAVK